MQRNCDDCGRPYEAKRATSKFCKPACRVRASEQRKRVGASVTPLAPVPVVTVAGVEAAARVELDAAGRADTVLGRQVLALAARMDASLFDTGSAYAALSRELRATLEVAILGAKVAADPMDEIAARRVAKAGA